MRGVSVLWYVYGRTGVGRGDGLRHSIVGYVGCLITEYGYRADWDGVDCAVL